MAYRIIGQLFRRIFHLIFLLKIVPLISHFLDKNLPYPQDFGNHNTGTPAPPPDRGPGGSRLWVCISTRKSNIIIYSHKFIKFAILDDII